MLRSGNEIEVVARCLFFLLEIHHGPIASSGNLEPILAELDKSVRTKVVAAINQIPSVFISCLKVGGLCDLVGTNLAGLRHLQGRLEEQRGVEVTVFPNVLLVDLLIRDESRYSLMQLQG